jgi:hypothetical protein
MAPELMDGTPVSEKVNSFPLHFLFIADKAF